MTDARSPLVYHITEEASLHNQLGNPVDPAGEALYFPAAYEADGFIHACSDGNELIPIGNHFYKSSVGKWVCLEIDTRLLDCETKYEPPAPVAGTASHHVDGQKLFPHCYGGISAKSIVRIMNVVREDDGSFVSIEGL